MGLERLRGAYRSTFVQVMALGTAIKIVKALHLFSHPVCTDWSMSSTSQQVTAMGRIEMGCHVRSPGLSREEFGGTFLGLMAYLESKDEGDNSMSEKQRCSKV